MNKLLSKLDRPLAITMWDYSWLERRWTGGGFENYGRALDELAERGYSCVRIDPYPHLLASGRDQAWELLPVNPQHDWGSPSRISVKVWPALIEFLTLCKERSISVALSSWFRKDIQETRLRIVSPEDHAAVWIKTLSLIEAEGLLDTIVYTDLCNEWPCENFAAFYKQSGPDDWSHPASLTWMREALEHVRKAYPEMPVAFSTVVTWEKYRDTGVEFFDFIESHLWMALQSDFNQRIGYSFQKDPSGFENVRDHAERIFRENQPHWTQFLATLIRDFAAFAQKAQRPVVTTEGWAIVDYKDGPRLDWGWVKELNALAVREASATGAWAAITTSNFAAPQFTGMWQDIEWHQTLNHLIRKGALPQF